MATRPILTATVLGAGLFASAALADGVRSLSQDEMVETYIQDSAIVVSPRSDRQRRSVEESRARAVRALVRPGEPIRTEADETQTIMERQQQRMASLDEAQRFAEQEFLRQALASSADPLAGVQPRIDTGLAQPSIPGYGVPDIPEGPFSRSYENGQLGLSFDGETLNFSMGNNPPGVGAIDLPKGIDDGPVKLTPKPGGGFDLSIDVPQQ
ncbi:hypothetical protein [Salicola sp. Rm-C-2C1-2]|uniref:hypothetical protein n=1 Tax=Salicola sp. Rm-C-2C1-2 TaxID=3141321 RepID=UPI0032E4D4B2